LFTKSAIKVAVDTTFTVRKDFNQDSAQYYYRENIYTQMSKISLCLSVCICTDMSSSFYFQATSNLIYIEPRTILLDFHFFVFWGFF